MDKNIVTKFNLRDAYAVCAVSEKGTIEVSAVFLHDDEAEEFLKVTRSKHKRKILRTMVSI